MNKTTLTIDGTDYTKKLIYPIKWGDFLDERLDEAYITIKNVKQAEPFLPLTPVTLNLTNAPGSKIFKTLPERDGVEQTLKRDGTLIQTQEISFVVADDTVNEYPVGSGFYTHDIYLIEETKLLEGFICDSIQFPNALGKDYAE